MHDINRALADISSIRSQLAAGAMFRGFGPIVIAVTGGLAVVTASAQSIWPNLLMSNATTFFACWIVTAIIAACLIGTEMSARSRRHHGGLADAMIWNAIEQFLPAVAAGVAVACVLWKFVPGSQWMLPGLWQIFVALGLFTSARSLPRTMTLVGAWYFIAGTGALIVASFSQSLAPWLMGLPFAVGQILMAAVLHFASGDEL